MNGPCWPIQKIAEWLAKSVVGKVAMMPLVDVVI